MPERAAVPGHDPDPSTETGDHDGPPSFVGRSAEFGRLKGGLEQALSGSGSVFLIVGEPGIGKTRLASELTQEAESLGFVTAWGRCWEGGGAPLLWPWVHLLRALELPSDEVYSRLGNGSPLARAMFPDLEFPNAEASEDPEADRFALFDVVATLLRERSARHPLLLVLDDLHDADEQSLGFLRLLSRTLQGTRLVACGTYRGPEAELRPTVASTLRDVRRDAAVLSLTGLVEKDVATLVERTAGNPAHPGIVRALFEATEGNPLFVSEMVRLLLAEGLLSGVRPPASFPIPEGVRQTIGRRLELLSPQALSTLETAAVFGPEFDFPPLREVEGSDPEALMSALGELTNAGLLQTMPDDVGRYRFSHGLVRDAVYRDIPTERLKRLHLEAGRTLERRHAGIDTTLAEVAHHLQSALPLGDPQVAFDYSLRSARRGASLFANDEAARRYRETLRIYEFLEDRDPRLRCELLLEMGLAENLAGHREESRETFSQAMIEAQALGDPELLARAALGYGRESWMTGVVDWKLVGMLDEALASLGPEDSPLRVDVLTRLATELYSSDDHERRLQLSQEGLDTARRLEDPQAQIYALDAKITVNGGPDNVEDRLASGAEMILLAGQTPRRIGVLTGRMWRVPALLEVGDGTRFHQELEAYEQEAKALRATAHQWFTTVVRATWSQLRGRFEEADGIARSAVEVGAETRGDEAYVYRTIQRFSIEKDRASAAILEEIMNDLSELAHRHVGVPAYGAAAAWLAARLDREPEARRRIEEIAAHGIDALPRDLTWLATLALLAETAALLHDATIAGEILRLLEPYSSRIVLFDFAVACYGSVARYQGLAATVLEQYDQAIVHFERGKADNARLGAAPFVAHCERELAAVLLARNGLGDRARASDLLTSALDGYSSLSMDWHRQEVEDQLADLGLRPASERPARARAPSLFRREGDTWAMTFEGDAFRLKDAKGLAYLARLLAEPGREFHALDLFTASAAGTTPRAGDDLHADTGGSAGALLDPKAKEAYRRRLADLEEEAEDAEAANDPERAAKAREERDFLVRELAAAVGLGGRDRPTDSAAERARVNVTKAVRTAIGRITEHSAALGQHLDRTVRTGTFCSYQPDPRAQVGWRVTP